MNILQLKQKARKKLQVIIHKINQNKINIDNNEKNFLDTETSLSSKNNYDNINNNNIDNLFNDKINKYKENDKNFQYKITDLQEGDMITSYIEHQIEKKLKLKYPGGMPIKNIKNNNNNNKSPNVNLKIIKNKIFEIPKKDIEIMMWKLK
jgi:hypothetical protein